MGNLFTINGNEFHIDGCQINGFESFDVDLETVREEYVRESQVIKFDSGDFSCTVSCRWDKYLFWKIAGLWDWLLTYCPDRRVAHLMKNGRTERIRRKNFKRALHIIGVLLDEQERLRGES